MEDISNNKVLCLNNEENIARKKAVILSYLKKGVDVLAFFDTETTGLNVYPKVNLGMFRDRILEVGFIMYYRDSDNEIKPLMLDGKPITFQEYINPFRESESQKKRSLSVHDTNPEALAVHHITRGFLNGQEEFNGIKLDKPAPTFAEVKPFLEDFLCLEESSGLEGVLHFVAHNGVKFDAAMLTEEMNLVDQYDDRFDMKRTFESRLPSLIDTLVIMKDIYDKQDLLDRRKDPSVEPNNTMSYLSHMLGVKEEGRENFHGALLDSLILKNIFNEWLKTPEMKYAKNQFKIKKVGDTLGYKKPVPLQSLLEGSDSLLQSAEVMTIIKTDASMNEGTGLVSEYIEEAKSHGIKNLVMADVLSLARFVEFYEGCKKADINPIMGVTFKTETPQDIYNFLNKNKDSGAINDLLDVVNEVMKLNNIQNFENMSNFVEEYNVDLIELNKSFESVVELNKKKYVKNETKQKSLNDLVTKVVKSISSLAGIKIKAVDADNIKLIFDKINEKTNLIKFNPFSRVDGHSDLLLIAKNDEGVDSLRKLISVANMNGQGFAKKGLGKGENPLIKLEEIEKYKDSLIAVVGHKKDILGSAVKFGDVKRSQLIIRELKEIFGDNLLCQISVSEQLSNRIEENKYIQNVSDVCSAQNVKVIATQNASFAKREDYSTHVNKFAIQLEKLTTAVTLDSGKTEEEFINSPTHLNQLFSNNNKLINNSGLVMEGIKITPVLHKPKLPKFKTKDGKTQDEDLYEKAVLGLKKRLPSAFKRQVMNGNLKGTKENYLKFCTEYKERLDYEIKIINDMDFSGYFLIKQQMIEFCKREGITVGAGRGSAAGSLVVYSLGITDADPIEHGLIFERFLNPERKEMPDIDTDIDGKDRIKVLKFLVNEYKEEGLGFSGAAYIMTKGTYSAKSSLKAIARISGMSQFWADELSGMINSEPGTKIGNELELNEELIKRYDTEAKTRIIIDSALALEKNGGRQASIGKHAGGLVVGDLINQAAITMIDGVPVIQADKYDVETLGAVKFDLLGVETLTKLDKTLSMIEMNLGLEVLTELKIQKDNLVYNFDEFRYDDVETFQMMKDANTSNVFQIESQMFKELLKKMKPDQFSEIVALVSLGRPGPMQSGMDTMFVENKFNPSARKMYHPLIDGILDETHGTIIYQEQVMAIAQKLSGFTMGGADKLRKAMGKKNAEEMAKQKDAFVKGAVKNNVKEETAVEIYDAIEKFAGYGFNKSHALAYSLLTYKMAFFRKHYPTETMAAIMSVDGEGSSAYRKIKEDLQSCKEVGLTVYPPNINKSNIDFTPNKKMEILYGLNGIKGITLTKVIAEREKNGEFKNIENYIKRCGAPKSLTSLISVGAMDTLELIRKPSTEQIAFIKTLEKEDSKILKRMLILAEAELLIAPLSSADKRKSYKEGQMNESDMVAVYDRALKRFKKDKPKIIADMLNVEFEILGGYITAHPLDIGQTRVNISKNTNHKLVKVNEIDDIQDLKAKVSTCGCVKKFVYDKTSKRGGKYAIIEVSDENTVKSFFMSNDAFHKLNNEIKAVNGKGLQEGFVLGFDVEFYGAEDIRSSISSVYVEECKIVVNVGKDPKPEYKNKKKRYD